MLVNWILFYSLLVQASVCLVLIFPFGRTFIQKTVSWLDTALTPFKGALNYAVNIVASIIVITFTSNLYSAWKHMNAEEILSDGMRLRLLLAQRDTYISGGNMFLFLLLRLIYLDLVQSVKVSKSLEAMEKQARNASDAYKKSIGELDTLTKENKKLKHLNTDDGKGSTVLDKLLAENAELQRKMDDHSTHTKRKDEEIEAIKKQASAQGDAFKMMVDDREETAKKLAAFSDLKKDLEAEKAGKANLEKEVKDLKKQLEDYEFMFADQLKKAKVSSRKAMIG